VLCTPPPFPLLGHHHEPGKGMSRQAGENRRGCSRCPTDTPTSLPSTRSRPTKVRGVRHLAEVGGADDDGVPPYGAVHLAQRLGEHWGDAKGSVVRRTLQMGSRRGVTAKPSTPPPPHARVNHTGPGAISKRDPSEAKQPSSRRLPSRPLHQKGGQQLKQAEGPLPG